MNRKLSWVERVALSVGVLSLAACGGSTLSTGSDGGDGGEKKDAPSSGDGAGDAAGDAGHEVPLNHRPNDSQCAQTPAPGTCMLQNVGGQCSQDSQCTSGTNGRCIENNGGALFCQCTYDTCTQDTDCPTGDLCVCHGSPYTFGAGNTCMMGNCRVDSDCGASGYCSPTVGTSGCGSVGGYYCHTAADQCVNDSDCSGSMSGPELCEWSATNNRWQCTMELLCG
jgi:hypothetical protein